MGHENGINLSPTLPAGAQEVLHDILTEPLRDTTRSFMPRKLMVGVARGVVYAVLDGAASCIVFSSDATIGSLFGRQPDCVALLPNPA